MKTIIFICSLFSIPIGFLNVFGGIVAGTWLAIIRQWHPIGYGLLAYLLGGTLLAFALMPGLLFVAPAAHCAERGNRIGLCIFGLLSSLYTITIIAGWCLGVFAFFGKFVQPGSAAPILIWSYGIALAPLALAASKEQQSDGTGNEGSLIIVFFASIACISVILLLLLGHPQTLLIVLTFAAILSIGVVCNFVIALSLMSHESKQISNITDEV